MWATCSATVAQIKRVPVLLVIIDTASGCAMALPLRVAQEKADTSAWV